jgi:hypothetical protein
MWFSKKPKKDYLAESLIKENIILTDRIESLEQIVAQQTENIGLIIGILEKHLRIK